VSFGIRPDTPPDDPELVRGTRPVRGTRADGEAPVPAAAGVQSASPVRSLVPWFVVGLAVQAAIAAGLHLWGRWVARRHGTRRWRCVAWLPAVALALNLVGAAATVWLVDRAPPSPGPVGPEARAAWRRQWTGAGAVGLGSAAVAALLYGASVALSLVGTVRASGGPTGSVPAATRGPSAAPRGSGSSERRGR
jgi:hypothetical protein